MLIRRSDDSGFAMVTVILVAALAMMTALIAIDVADHARPGAQARDNAARAQEAAEAGAEWYQYELNRNIDYWTKCATGVAVTNPQGVGTATTVLPINNPTGPSGPDGVATVVGQRRWRNIGGGQYSVDLLPTRGQSCSVPNAQGTMLSNNQLTIRSIGRYRDQTRTLVTTFARPSFLEYLYFTDYELQDPYVMTRNILQQLPAYAAYAGPFGQWAVDNCPYYRNGRPSVAYLGLAGVCDLNGITNIQFGDQDDLEGPVHTNDEFLTCGSPTLGRTADRVEVTSARTADGWRAAPNCPNNPPKVNHDPAQKITTGAPFVPLPPTSRDLQSVAGPKYTFTGNTDIYLDGEGDHDQIVVTKAGDTSGTVLPPPSNGVIYVNSSDCSTTPEVVETYNQPSGCGIARVHGISKHPLTIASDFDIVVTGDVLAQGEAPLPVGLIADRFVRVYHPVDANTNNATSGPYGPQPEHLQPDGSRQDLEIDAAILSLKHSFLVDNVGYGAPLGKLIVRGAIAQKYRGPVATSAVGTTTVNHGFVKSYSYIDKLKTQEPPSFIDPTVSTWRVVKQVEQRPKAPGL